MLKDKNKIREYVNKDTFLMKNVICFLNCLIVKERVDYLNRENFKLLDKLLYISRKEGKLSKTQLRNKKFVHNSLNT
jgi:hypothetical protein